MKTGFTSVSLANQAIAVFKASAILFMEIVLFCKTLSWGLVIGSGLAYWFTSTFSSDPVNGPVYAYKEVLWSAVIILCMTFFIIVPIQRQFILPLWEDIYKEIGYGPDLIFAIIDAYALGFCFAQISILFELRYCKKDFDFKQLRGPISSFSYILNHYHGNTGIFYGVGKKEGLEKTIMFPLFVGFAYPIYSFIRSYFMNKSSAYSVTGFIERIFPKPCSCCESVENDNDYGKIDWKAQFVGLALELMGLCSLYLYFIIGLNIATAFAGSERPGFLFIASGVLAFLCSMGIALAEMNFKKPCKNVESGVETRILLNLAVFVFFVTKNFLVVFERVKEDVCSDGHMEIKSEISQSFALYFTISVYAAWKIIFLSIAFSYNIERQIAKAEKLFWIRLKPTEADKFPTSAGKNFQRNNDKSVIPMTHGFTGQAHLHSESKSAQDDDPPPY